MDPRKQVERPRIEVSQYRSYLAVHPFDRQFGVETGGLIYDIETGHPHDCCNNGYFGVAPSVFEQAMKHLPPDRSRFCFVDLGSGKGRALMLAAEQGFSRIVGVEISAPLHRIAGANIARFIANAAQAESISAPIDLRHGDAADFIWPPGPLVVYMWNAFTGPVMERVLENLKIALLHQPREAYLLYVHPELAELLDSLPWLERIWMAEIRLSELDFAAWAFPARAEVCAIYRATA